MRRVERESREEATTSQASESGSFSRRSQRCLPLSRGAVQRSSDGQERERDRDAFLTFGESLERLPTALRQLKVRV